MEDSWKQMFESLVFPWLFLWASARHIPVTVRDLVSTGKYRALFSVYEFCDALFGHFWATAGPLVKAGAQEKVIPLLEGRVSNGEVHAEAVGPPVEGVVLEIGAGSGMWADVFAKLCTSDTKEGEGARRRLRNNSKITRIYGVEPHPASAAALRKRVKEVGIDDIYEVVPVGIESLDTQTTTYIEPESVDCVVSVLCLCSIPDQQNNIKEIYRLLKPGGRWYAYEHVRAEKGGLFLKIYQRVVNVFWSFLVGSCRLCNPTGTNLRNSGSWQKIDLTNPPDEPTYRVLPHVIGTLTK